MSTLYSRVRDVPNGTQITKPGIYRVPIGRYHHDANLFPGHSVSSTGLRRMTQSCPEKYWAYSVHNPNHIHTPPSEALRFGKAVHSFLLEHELSPEEFAICDFENWSSNEGWDKYTDGNGVRKKGYKQPDGTISKLYIDKNGIKWPGYKAYKQAWKFCANWSEKSIVMEKDIAVFKAMAARLAKEPMIQDGILEGLVEHTICWPDPETGIWIKVRPDVVPGAVMLGDYKTSKSAHPRDINRAIAEYGYDQQLALCMEGIARVLGRQIDSAFFVVQEKVEPYMVTIAPVDDDTLWWGARLNRKALNDIKRCLDAGEWPGYGGGGPVTARYPEWRHKQLLAHQEAFDGDPEMRIPDVENLSQILGKL